MLIHELFNLLLRRPRTVGRPVSYRPLAASAGSAEPWHLLEAQDAAGRELVPCRR